MKLGDIKIQALKLMFVNYNDDISIDSLPTLSTDQNYGSYLVNMPGSINRCFASIEEKKSAAREIIYAYIFRRSESKLFYQI